MASQVEICNMALGHAEQEAKLQDINEGTPEADACKLYYDPILENMQRDHSWNFTNSFIVLASVGNPPAPWLYKYAYPVGCLRALEIVNPDGPDAGRVPFKVVHENGTKFIVCNLEGATLNYSAKVTDPNLFDPSFTLTFSWVLSSFVAPILAGRGDIADRCSKNAARAWLSATVDDSNEGEEDLDETADYIKARL